LKYTRRFFNFSRLSEQGGIMKANKGQYIRLAAESAPEADSAEVKFSLDSQVVGLSGRGWGWVWNRPKGVVVHRGEECRRVPIIDFTRWIQAILYGVSIVLVAIGVYKQIAGRGGEVNGG
jgi:hypothetical protein